MPRRGSIGAFALIAALIVAPAAADDAKYPI